MSKLAHTDQFRAHYRLTRRRLGMASSFVAGLATLLTISGPSAIAGATKRPRMNNSLRGDFARIGDDMRSAIEKERQSEEADR